MKTSNSLPDRKQGVSEVTSASLSGLNLDKSVTYSWREELDEYGQLHSLGCEVNSEYGADVGTDPTDCCENMRLIAGFVQEQIDRENMRWVKLARAHRPYCRPEGSKMLTRAIRNRQIMVSDMVATDKEAHNG